MEIKRESFDQPGRRPGDTFAGFLEPAFHIALFHFLCGFHELHFSFGVQFRNMHGGVRRPGFLAWFQTLRQGQFGDLRCLDGVFRIFSGAADMLLDRFVLLALIYRASGIGEFLLCVLPRFGCEDVRLENARRVAGELDLLGRAVRDLGGIAGFPNPGQFQSVAAAYRSGIDAREQPPPLAV